MTTTEVVEDKAVQNIREAVEAVEADMANLPTVEELVGPIATAIRQLHDLQDLAWNISFLDAGDEHEARFVALIEDVASLVEAAVDRCIAGEERALDLGRAARHIVFAVTQAAGTCRQHHARRVEHIIDQHQGGAT